MINMKKTVLIDRLFLIYLNMKATYTVYKHTNKVNGKVYIGITKQKVTARWRNGNGYKSNKHFFNAIEKYGWDSFDHEILFDHLEELQAKILEISLIHKYNSTDSSCGYNLTFGGEGGNKGLTEEDRKQRRKKYVKKYYQQNKEKIKQYDKEYQQKNKEKIRQRQAEYDRREDRKQYHKEYNQREDRKQYQKEYDQREDIKQRKRERNQQNKDKIKEYNKEYYQRKKRS